MQLPDLLAAIDRVEQEIGIALDASDQEAVRELEGRRQNLVRMLCHAAAGEAVGSPAVAAVQELIAHYEREVGRLEEVREQTRALILKARRGSRGISAYRGS